mmetsp:Transcript_5999/g.9959  ORF Transcript_5999/g.9959 Transcript_5999/m.9959 type:complete len:292 (+) Transcript_5999:125-1000(+)
MTKNRAQQDQEMLQSTMFAILDSLFWGMIVGTGCLIMSYVLPLTEDSDGRELGSNLDLMANSLFWGATAGSGCLLALYTLIGALYPPTGDSGSSSWLDPPAAGSRKRGSGRDQKHGGRGNNRKQISSGKGQEKDLQRSLERGDNDWLIMHMDRILVACCCIMNFPLFSWVLGQDILWWGGLFAVILVTSFLDRSQYLERMPLSPSTGNGNSSNNQTGPSGNRKSRRALKNSNSTGNSNNTNGDPGLSPEVADLLQKLSKQYFSLFIFGIIAVWSMGSLMLFRFDSEVHGQT